MVGISNVIGIQILYPKGKINTVIRSCIFGAVLDLALCILLIPVFSYNGTAIAYVVAETTTTLAMCILGRKYIKLHYFKKAHLTYFLGAILMGVVVIFLGKMSIQSVLIYQIICGSLVYFICLLLNKDIFVMNLLCKLKRNEEDK